MGTQANAPPQKVHQSHQLDATFATSPFPPCNDSIETEPGTNSPCQPAIDSTRSNAIAKMLDNLLNRQINNHG
jgi:hypothetical protein